jgi:hypothetical protein
MTTPAQQQKRARRIVISGTNEASRDYDFSRREIFSQGISNEPFRYAS